MLKSNIFFNVPFVEWGNFGGLEAPDICGTPILKKLTIPVFSNNCGNKKLKKGDVIGYSKCIAGENKEEFTETFDVWSTSQRFQSSWRVWI